MNNHLSHAEMTDHLLGETTAAVQDHLRQCPACSNQLHQISASLELFRGTVQNWSEAEHGRHERASASVPSGSRFHWLVAGLATLALLTFTLTHFIQRPAAQQAQVHPAVIVPAVKSPQAQIDEDNQLLTQINQELAEGLPAPMQPLQVAVAQSTGSSSN